MRRWLIPTSDADVAVGVRECRCHELGALTLFEHAVGLDRKGTVVTEESLFVEKRGGLREGQAGGCWKG